MLLFVLMESPKSGRKVFDSQGQNGVVDEEHVSQTNGESEGPAATDDALILQASAEASGGSDTDTSRADIAELSEKELTGRKHHGRSNSVKKPTSFKAVSVTRNFLAKATAGSTPASKGSADKGKASTITLRKVHEADHLSVFDNSCVDQYSHSTNSTPSIGGQVWQWTSRCYAEIDELCK